MNVPVQTLRMIIHFNQIYILYEKTYEHFILRQLIESPKTSKTFVSNVLVCKPTHKVHKPNYVKELYNLYGNCLTLFTDSQSVGDMRLFITKVISMNRYRFDFYLLIITYFKREYPYLFIILASHACVDCNYRMCYKFVIGDKLRVVSDTLHQSVVTFVQGGVNHYKLQKPTRFTDQEKQKVGYDLCEISQYDYDFLRTRQCEIFDAIRIFVLCLDMEKSHSGDISNIYIDGYVDNLQRYTNYNVYNRHKQLLTYVSDLCAYIDNMSHTSIVDSNHPNVTLETLMTANNMIPTETLTRDSANQIFFPDEIHTFRYQKPVNSIYNPFTTMTHTLVEFVSNRLVQSLKTQLNSLYLNVLKFFIDRINVYYCAFDVILSKQCSLNIIDLNHIMKNLSRHGYLDMKTRCRNKLVVHYYARTPNSRNVKFTTSQLHHLLRKHCEPFKESILNFSFPHPKFSNTTGDYIV